MERPIGNLQKHMNCRVKHWQRRRRENEANEDVANAARFIDFC